MKTLPDPKDPIELIGQAYERLLESAVEEVKKLEDKSGPALHRVIDQIKQKLSDWEELTEEEIEKISDYLKRDLIDAASYLVETGEELKNWWGFEKALIKDHLADLFSQAADQTTVELMKLKEEAELAGYHAGEVTGPGTLVCDQCGEKLHFYQPKLIPKCPRCGGENFHRLHDE